jgi:hypothetical protein
LITLHQNEPLRRGSNSTELGPLKMFCASQQFPIGFHRLFPPLEPSLEYPQQPLPKVASASFRSSQNRSYLFHILEPSGLSVDEIYPRFSRRPFVFLQWHQRIGLLAFLRAITESRGWLAAE